jgi:serine protease Do
LTSRLTIVAVVCFALLASAGIGQVQARPAPDSFADLVEKLAPAVVNIATSVRTARSSAEDSPFDELPPGAPYEDFFEFFNKRNPDDNSFQPSSSLGSGFIIDPSGLVVTNNHVIADADEITVVLDDNTRLEAIVIGRDPKTDLALLKIEATSPLAHVEFGDSDIARVGDWVIAIGNPFGLGNTVTAGILSARGRDINAGPYDDFLQTDAPINRGNSGGPMFNMKGQVIGVNTLIYSPSGGSVGIGFATPAAIVRPVIDQLRSFGQTRRGWLGVRIQTVSPEIADKLEMMVPSGALVAAVIEEGPAQAADIREGDVILTFGGREVASRRALPRIVADAPIGEAVPVLLWRDGEEVTVDVIVGRLEEYELAASQGRVGRAAVERAFTSLGVTLSAITPDLREKFELGKESGGLVVTGVSDGLSSGADIQPGDIIIELGHNKVADLGDFERRLDALADTDTDLVVVLRERHGEREFIALEIRGG